MAEQQRSLPCSLFISRSEKRGLFVLVEEICGDTCFHMHMVAVSTCYYVGRVEKIANTTPKQAEKNRLNPKSNAIYKQTCGVP